MKYPDYSRDTPRQSWERAGTTLQNIHDAVGLHPSLFRRPGRLIFSKENRLQRVWIGLTTSGFHSLRIALYALESGHYAQSFALIRSALEVWLTAFDCKTHPETVEALLRSRNRVPRFATMAHRLPEKLKNLWQQCEGDDGTYGFLSTFAHPRQRALEATVNLNGTVLAVPEYGEIRFALAARFLIQAALLLLEFLERLADYFSTSASEQWGKHDLEVIKPQRMAVLGSLVGRLNSYTPDH